ncbi:MAG TPA: ATP synthase F0 subunit B [Pyrinomonadaceae bacterium]|jgi:F-type H+-transporting ATPase subunit b|nr:ATP synthase F0 subunit B [Pyrinomonadaceae bacterium]
MILLEASIQLVPDGTLLLHLLMVGVMVFVLNRTLLKPINQILAEREKQIAGRLKEAEAMASETQEKLKRYNDALREARTDGYKLLEKERAQAMKEKEEKLRQYREQMSKEVAAQVETTRRQEQTVKGELEAQAATIGSLISSQILRRPTR